MKQCLSLLLVFCMLAPFSLAQQTKANSAPVINAASVPFPAAKLAVKYTPDGKPILEDGTPVRLRL